MYIVMVTPECAPVAKVGGLGDVVYGLSRELEIRGNPVEIIVKNGKNTIRIFSMPEEHRPMSLLALRN